MSGLTFPTVLDQQTSPFLEAVFVQCITSVYDIKQYVIEQGLKGRNAGPFDDQQCGQAIGAGDANVPESGPGRG